MVAGTTFYWTKLPQEKFSATRNKSCNGDATKDKSILCHSVETSITLPINEDIPLTRRTFCYTSKSNLQVIFIIWLITLVFSCAICYIARTQDEKICKNGKCEETNVFIYDGIHQTKSWPNPPAHQKTAQLARYVMHISEWGSLATTSTHKNIEGYPFVNVFSVSDGPYNNSTGVPYFYFTPLELSVRDLKVDNKSSLTVSLAQSDYCVKNRMDPEDPRCAHIILTGEIIKLGKGSDEETFARDSLFSRHWEMSTWPTGHSWFLAKLNIEHIYVLDFFGGAKVVDINEYFEAGFEY